MNVSFIWVYIYLCICICVWSWMPWELCETALIDVLFIICNVLCECNLMIDHKTITGLFLTLFLTFVPLRFLFSVFWLFQSFQFFPPLCLFELQIVCVFGFKVIEYKFEKEESTIDETKNKLMARVYSTEHTCHFVTVCT